MKAKDRRLEQIKAIIPEVTPAKAVVRQSYGAVIVDVREADEVARGSPINALHLQRAFLKLQTEEHITDTDCVLLLLCATGVRSLFAAENLKQLGYRNVYSVADGFERWKKEGLPFEIPRMLDNEARDRYALNPSVNVITYPTRLEASNVEDILKGYDIIIIDGSDNLATRYLVNDVCVRLGLPNIHGAVHRFEGQVTVFWQREGDKSHDQASPCYRCLYPEPPSQETAPSCNEAGVLSVLPGIIGLLQAVEAVKIVLGIGQPLIGKMLYYDALKSDFMRVGLKANTSCPCCATQSRFEGYNNYQQVCPQTRVSLKQAE